MRKPILAFLSGVLLSGLLVAGGIAVAQTETVLGELKRLSRIWDGTDVWLIDGSGNGMIAGTVTANAGSNLNTSALALDATLTNRLPAGSTPGDNESNAITTSRLGSYMWIFDGSTWDRWTGAITGTVTANAGTNLNTSALLTTAAHDGAFGTAGAADAQVRTIQGVASMTPVVVSATDLDVQIGGSDSLTIGTFPDNEPVNVAQMNGVAVTMGNGVSGTGVQRVTIASDSTGQVAVASFPDNEPVNVAQKGGSAIAAGPCEREVNLYAQVDQTSGEQIITGTASERVYICSVAIVTATAQNIALVDGTGSVCATSPTGLTGGSTAATGQNYAANGGWVLPFNPQAWAKTSTDADNVCLLQSGSGQISGVITYVSIPNI